MIQILKANISMGVILFFASSIVISTHCNGAENSNSSVGVGVGMIYGIAGAKIEYSIFEKMHISVGLGEIPSVGFQYYLRDFDTFWRPRISLYYGRVSSLNMERGMFSNDTLSEYFQGGAIELGQNFQFGWFRHHSVEFGITFRLTDGGKSERASELEKAGYHYQYGEFASKYLNAINLGYRYNF